ncbi:MULTISPECIES: hypothetical protein [unclassified Streptomyces]|uniref:hypothetical protein n=1 Tax=unclassified Streptomyces TaxID=2593676 RepID=UPI0035DEB5A2
MDRYTAVVRPDVGRRRRMARKTPLYLNGVDDVLRCIADAFEPLLRFRWPAQGCHRPMDSYRAVPPAGVRPTPDIGIAPRPIHGVEVTA